MATQQPTTPWSQEPTHVPTSFLGIGVSIVSDTRKSDNHDTYAKQNPQVQVPKSRKDYKKSAKVLIDRVVLPKIIYVHHLGKLQDPEKWYRCNAPTTGIDEAKQVNY